LERLATRWVTVPSWPERVTTTPTPTAGKGARREDVVGSCPVRRLLVLTRESAAHGRLQPFAQRVLMLSAVGVPVGEDALKLCEHVLARLPAKERQKVRAVASVWARQVRSRALQECNERGPAGLSLEVDQIWRLLPVVHRRPIVHKIQSMDFPSTSRPESQPPLTEVALRRLRHDVLVGTLAAGNRLKLDTLQQQYGLSSSPLREALSRLTQEGLVRADERRGFRVASLSLDDLADITRLRLMVDVEALQDAMSVGDDEWEGNVVAAFHRLEKIEGKLSDGPVLLDDEWSDVHRNFHTALIRACPSDRLRQLSASLFDQAERYRRVSAKARQTARRKSNEHKRIMDAVLRRDKETACELLRDHIKSTRKNVEAAMRASAAASFNA
jgi:DNA-binding GntR family transcriptional regulator